MALQPPPPKLHRKVSGRVPGAHATEGPSTFYPNAAPPSVAAPPPAVAALPSTEVEQIAAVTPTPPPPPRPAAPAASVSEMEDNKRYSRETSNPLSAIQHGVLSIDAVYDDGTAVSAPTYSPYDLPGKGPSRESMGYTYTSKREGANARMARMAANHTAAGRSSTGSNMRRVAAPKSRTAPAAVSSGGATGAAATAPAAAYQPPASMEQDWLSRIMYKLCITDRASEKAHIVAMATGLIIGIVTLCIGLAWATTFLILAFSPVENKWYLAMMDPVCVSGVDGCFRLPNPLWWIFVAALPLLCVQMSYLLSWSFYHVDDSGATDSHNRCIRCCNGWFWPTVPLIPCAPISGIVAGICCCIDAC